MLGPVDLKLGPLPPCDHPGCYSHVSHPCEGCGRIAGRLPVDWVVAGCESGHNRRCADVDWFRNLRDQCQVAGVPFFLKQGEVRGRVVSMPQLYGRVWDELPEWM